MRILLISYYFPPCGGAPVQRWLKWLPDLVEQGFKVTVLTTRNGDYPQLDESLLADIPSEVQVIRTDTWSAEGLWHLLRGKESKLPHGNLESGKSSSLLHRILVWVRLNLIIPDIRVIWNHSAWKAASRFLQANPIDAVITTGPPHSTHLLGMKIKKLYNIPWIADWRDPWTSIYYMQLNPPGALSRAIHRRLEHKVATSADLNLTVSEHLAEHLKGAKTQVLYNGYDARKQTESEEIGQSDKFRVKFVGSITEGQNLESMASVIGKALKDKQFELSFVGTDLSSAQKLLLDRLLPGKYSVKYFARHARALREMRDAELLVLLINYYPGFEGMLTTKLFEYLASRSRILCLGPHGGEAEALIRAYAAGACFDTGEAAQAADFVLKTYHDWKEGNNLKNKADIGELSSSRQVLKLADRLYRIKKR